VILFLFTCIILGVLKYQQPAVRYTLGKKAEIWAEAATNYFLCAHYEPALSCYSKTDAGYLAIFPRILSNLIEFATQNPQVLPKIQQGFAILAIILCCASVALSSFSKIFGPSWARFLLAVLLSFHFDYELHTFINASYYLSIPASALLLGVISNQEKKPSVLFLTALVVSLATLSKGILICLFPMCFFAASFLAVKRRIKCALILLTPVTFATVLQLVTMLASVRNSGVFPINANSSIYSLAWTSFSTFIDLIINLPLNRWLSSQPIQNILVFLIFSAALGFVWRCSNTEHKNCKPNLTRERLEFLVQILLLMAGAFTAHLIVVKATFRVFDFGEYVSFPSYSRVAVTQSFLLLLFYWVLLNYLLKGAGRPIRIVVTVFTFGLFSLIGAPFRYQDTRNSTDQWYISSFSNWSEFSKYFTSEVACAPINPYPWFFGRNCRPLKDLPEFGKFKENLIKIERFAFSVPKDLVEKDIRFVGFFIENNLNSRILNLNIKLRGKDGVVVQSLKRNGGPFVFFPFANLNVKTNEVVELILNNPFGTSIILGVPDPQNVEGSAIWLGSD